MSNTERTDADKLSAVPLVFVMGGEEYKIFPKPIMKSRVWKRKALPIVEQMQKMFNIDSENLTEAIPFVIKFLFETMDELIELVFEWEEELPKEKILNTATEEELFNVMLGVIGLAFPLVQKLGILEKLKNFQSTN